MQHIDLHPHREMSFWKFSSYYYSCLHCMCDHQNPLSTWLDIAMILHCVWILCPSKTGYALFHLDLQESFVKWWIWRALYFSWLKFLFGFVFKINGLMFAILKENTALCLQCVVSQVFFLDVGDLDAAEIQRICNILGVPEPELQASPMARGETLPAHPPPELDKEPEVGLLKYWQKSYRAPIV